MQDIIKVSGSRRRLSCTRHQQVVPEPDNLSLNEMGGGGPTYLPTEEHLPTEEAYN